jgi:hypothetical protein
MNSIIPPIFLPEPTLPEDTIICGPPIIPFDPWSVVYTDGYGD